jgi:transcriptional regulator with XRE-family HTH domain
MPLFYFANKKTFYEGETMKREILRASRALQRLTQKDLAERIGISESHYCQIERGYVEPSPLERLRIQEILGPTIDQISSAVKNN